MRSLEYVPYGPGLYGRPHVFVDGLRAPGTVLELSHWPGNQTPHRLKDDVSTQSVLRLLALAGPERDSLLGEASAVTCDHYDVDGLLSVLCLTRPEFALRHRSLLAAVAVCGDFDVYTGDAAVQACLALLAAEREVFSRIAPVSVDQAATALFQGMLDVPRVCGEALAERLNRDERNGTWFCEPAATVTPLLQLYTTSDVPAPSSHRADRLRDRVLAYFQEASLDASLRWTPHAGWEHEAPGGPPSKETA
jgi:hypothetical protein